MWSLTLACRVTLATLRVRVEAMTRRVTVA
jgi:hypothetical protein